MEQRPIPEPRFAWGSRRQIAVALGVVVTAIVSLGALAFGVLLPLLLDNQQPEFTGRPKEILANLILLTYSLFFVYAVLVRWARVPWRELGWGSNHWKRDLALGLLGHALTQVVFLTYMASHGLTLRAYLEMVSHFPISRRLAALVIAIQAPLLEESVYRGYLQRGIEGRTGAWAAVLLTALVFSISNLRFDPAHLLMNFSYGLIWGVLRMKTRGLVAPAFAHSLNWVVNAGV
jgi:membrane protease YdiL (CAAX protease family)